MTPRILGIAGPSGSGKTELALWLQRRTGALIVNLDHYYVDLAHEPLEARAARNFDEPAALDEKEILRDVRDLAAGRAITAPVYDFTLHTRAPGGQLIHPAPLIILEGLFTLYWPALRGLLHFSIYVDTPLEICFQRRLERDTRERGRTPESVRRQFADTVEPMSRLHILPTRRFAQLVIDGVVPVETMGARAHEFLSRAGAGRAV